MMWGGAMFFGWIFWAVVIVGVIWLLSYLLRSHSASGRDRGPIEILKERLARGEISSEEYEEKRRMLMNT